MTYEGHSVTIRKSIGTGGTAVYEGLVSGRWVSLTLEIAEDGWSEYYRYYTSDDELYFEEVLEGMPSPVFVSDTPTPTATSTPSPIPTPVDPDYSKIPTDADIPEGWEKYKASADWVLYYDGHPAYVIYYMTPNDSGGGTYTYRGYVNGEWVKLYLSSISGGHTFTFDYGDRRITYYAPS